MNTAETKKKVQELSRTINRMRDELCLAINDERYEDAAKIRDQAVLRQKELTQLLT